MILLAPKPPAPNYAACIDVLLELAHYLEVKRDELRLTNQAQAKAIGITQSTLTGLYQGRNPQSSTVLRCLHWLNANR